MFIGQYVYGINDTIHYFLYQRTDAKSVEITIEFDSINTAESYLTIPRSAPGTYEITDYSRFVEDVNALTLDGEVIKGMQGIGSFFFFSEEAMINKISYRVNILKMESELKGGFACSKGRDNYLGILGYSVFGLITSLQDRPIVLTIQSDTNWPIFTTLNPTVNYISSASLMVKDYATLVDAQYLLGSDVQIYQVKGAPIPLIIAAYAETEIDIEEIGRRAQISLNGLSDYFGYIPMPHYTVCYEFLIPFSDEHSYGFSMEHMNSMTASQDTSRAIKGYEENPNIGSMVHHIGHSWIPLRSYGKGYRPFDWGTAPIIETIWLNEGFIWYVMTVVLDNPNRIKWFNGVVKNAPRYIKEKTLKELSQLGSTQYSADFNIGRNLFSRGALMAHEMDIRIQRETDHNKSFKDALLGLLKWTDKNQRAFEYEEIEPILSNATGVDLKDIWMKWQEAPDQK
jgi:predicted metalloprotease with PDZ domain